ncbi:MAG: L,D-transpeptidase [Opitutales bacterium]
MGTRLSQDVLIVRLGQQKLEHWKDGLLVRVFKVSTGKNPPSCVENSGGTPTGLHVICEKIGVGVPLDTVFVGRESIGRTWRELKSAGEAPEKAHVTTRILRLRGLEQGKNAGPGVDSYNRYIYFHGTVFEDRIGEGTSAGCVTLLNTDMIELFDAVPEGTLVWICAR